ncbi:MAG: hypothetical protein ABSG90_03435 [Dehalococcoidia bacterium]
MADAFEMNLAELDIVATKTRAIITSTPPPSIIAGHLPFFSGSVASSKSMLFVPYCLFPANVPCGWFSAGQGRSMRQFGQFTRVLSTRALQLGQV